VSSRKNYLILFLSLTSVAGAIVAWQQHQQVVQLRSAAAKREVTPTPLKPTFTISSAVNDTLPSPSTADEAGPSAPLPAETETPAMGPRPIRRDGPGPNHREMLERPEIQQLMALQQKSGLDSRYSALFKSLGLSPEQLERFKDLLVEKRSSTSDVRSAAREQGLNTRKDRATYEKLVADAQAEIDASIRDTIGEAGFAKYENYEKTLPQRNTVNQLEQRLSYSSTPLSSQQAEQLVAILAAADQGASTNVMNAPIPGMGPGPFAIQARGRDTRITDATINQALGVLAAPQVEALRQLKQEQEAQSALNAAMRNRFREGADAAVPPPPTSTGPTPITSPRPAPGG
jgi:hypothetical protein